VQVLIDPDAKHATKVASAKVLGTVTEVAAFTERKEISHVQNSDAIKTQIMAQLKGMMLGNDDAVTVDATDLLAELVGDNSPDSDDPTVPAPPVFANGTPPDQLHTIPHKASPNLLDEDTGSPIPQQSTPFDAENEDGGGYIFLENEDACQDATGRVSTLKVKS
jgi:hypothetical protein